MEPGGSHLGIATCCLDWWMSVCERLSESESGFGGRIDEGPEMETIGWSRMETGFKRRKCVRCEVSMW